jgi:hypothetical protein
MIQQRLKNVAACLRRWHDPAIVVERDLKVHGGALVAQILHESNVFVVGLFTYRDCASQLNLVLSDKCRDRADI